MYQYAIALGSNRRHHRYGSPSATLRAATTYLARNSLRVTARSPIIASVPVGPSIRTYANAAVTIDTDLSPEELLDLLKGIERTFGRRRGQRWSTRTLDLDIILWSGGCYTGPNPTIPHPLFRQRIFVLRPLRTVAPDWIDPVTRKTVRQLFAQAAKRRPKTVDRAATPD